MFIPVFAVVKATVIITCSECVSVAFVIQHAMRMRHIFICRLPSVQYFSTLSYKLHDFRKKKKVIERKMCFDFLYKSFLQYLSL